MNRTLTLLLSLALLPAATNLRAADVSAPAAQPTETPASAPAGEFAAVPPPSQPFTNETATFESIAADRAANELALSGFSARQRAKWQERLTLGPGDVLDISLMDQLDSERKGVVVSPDGHLNYMGAQNVPVTGLTVDELRDKLDAALGKYDSSPRSIVIPVSYRSKKFFMLGAVKSKGVFQLNRPTSLIEAVAQAGGLETGVLDRSPTELADLSHSFLVRENKRVPVDFEKLFLNGDLSQNIQIEPNDYLFFAPASLNEIYVLGSVNTPGPQPWDRTSTVISAITRHGSYSRDAFRQRVLVIRGSLNHPQTFVVDTAAILSAREPDFKLQPRDIVYVHSKPWAYAQELLQGAATAFVQAALITYTGRYIGPFIEEPIIKP